MSEQRRPEPISGSSARPEPGRPDAAGPRVSAWGATHTGRVRSRNEDTFLVRLLPPFPPGMDETDRWIDPDTPAERAASYSRVPVGAGGLLLLVADGMGGAPAGDVASRATIETVAERMEEAGAADTAATSPPPRDVDPPTAEPDALALRLAEAVGAAHDRLRAHQKAHPEHRGMGTTLTALLLMRSGVILAQVGDSRAYRLRDGELTRLTRDQTVAQQRVDEGRMTDEQARHSPESHMLLQAVGSGPTPDVAHSTDLWEPGDRFLLCSDGLTGVVPDAEIARLLMADDDPRAACDALLSAANDRGGPDNITVALVSLARD